MIKQNKSFSKNKVTYIGKDHLGNKYFEAERPHHQTRRCQRYFERENLDYSIYAVDVAKVPPAWDAWLRFRRKDPPTEDIQEDTHSTSTEKTKGEMSSHVV